MPEQAGSETIHPEALKWARKRRRMTQQELADAIHAIAKGCTKDTVSRWERGISRRVRSHLREPLCKVLRVKWEKLTEPPQPDPDDPRGILDRVQVEEPIGKKERNALYLVAERYGVHPRDVLELAPLLFFVVAERSLLGRQRRVDAIYAALDEGEERLRNDAGHLNRVIPICRGRAHDMLLEEEHSIATKDILGRLVQSEDWYGEDDGPFVTFVQRLAVGLLGDHPESIGSFSGEMPDRYVIAEDTLRECTGISGDEQCDDEILRHIRNGGIDLAECLRVRRDRDEAEYRKWLSEAATGAATQAKQEAQVCAVSLDEI